MYRFPVPKPLAEIVLEEGLTTAASLERAAAAADRDGVPLVVALVRECGLDEVALVAALRRHVRVATADPATVAPEPEAVRELQRDVCRRQRVAPLSLSSYGGRGRVLRLAMADPTDAVAVAEVEHVTACQVDPVLMTVSAIEELVERIYRALVTEVMKRVGEPAEAPPDAGRAARGKGVASSGGASPARVGAPTTTLAAGVRERAVDGPVTVPFHRLSEEADLETRLSAVIRLLLAKRIVSEDELEEEVRQLMRQGRDDEG